ncbi:MAG: hypothetical protein ACKO2G_09735 [Verrucomicrobiales bacterium]
MSDGNNDHQSSASPPPGPGARGPLFGCAVGLVGVVFFAALIAWTFWQGLQQNKAIDEFTRPEPQLQIVEKLPEDQGTAFATEIAGFTRALDEGTRLEMKASAAALNHLIATEESLASLRGQLHVSSISEGKINCSICYPINGLPWENKKRYLIGKVVMVPELTEGQPAFRVESLVVPGKEIPDWFTSQFSLYHLLERYQKDEKWNERIRQLSALAAEGEDVVVRTKAWKEQK